MATCSDSGPTGPQSLARAGFDMTGLVRAGSNLPIPIDSLRIQLRRTDSSLAYNRAIWVNAAAVRTNLDTIAITLDIPLHESPETFDFFVGAEGGGVTYYQVQGSVSVTAGGRARTPDLVPSYVGPGAQADSVTMTLTQSSVPGGDSVFASAQAWQGNSVVSGVPIGFTSSDSTKLNVFHPVGLDGAWVIAPALVTDSVDIIATTPTGLTDQSRLAFAPAPARIVLISGDAQVVPVGTQAGAPIVVQVQDASGAPYPLGYPVNFAIGTGPAGTTVLPVQSITDAQGLAQTTLTAGGVAGAVQGSVVASGLTGSPLGFTATVTGTAGAPAALVAVTALSQSATVGLAVASPPSVRVTDAQSVPVPGVTVTFAVATGNGTITGGTQVTGATGIATVGSWTPGNLAGANTLTATVVNLTPLTFTATAGPDIADTVVIVAGDSQTAPASSQLPTPLQVEVRDQYGNVTPGVTVAWSPAQGSTLPTSSNTDNAGRTQTVWTLGASPVNQSLTASVSGATPMTFGATATFATPAVLLSFTGVPGVGIGLSTTINVGLTSPAAAGGVVVSVTSDAPGTVSVGNGGTVTIPQSQTTGTITINGVSLGTTTVRGNAAGFTEGTLAVDVQDRSISLPPAINVPYGQTASLPIQLASPAPAGGVTFNVSSSASGFVGVQTPTVFIAAGSLTGNATLQGVLPGPATISVSNPFYITATSAATTSAALNITAATATINASFGSPVTINFESNGVATAAPSPGITVNLSATDPGCVAAVTPVSILTGLVSTTTTLTYGGSTALPCTTKVFSQATNLQPDSVTVTVNPMPGITVGTVNNTGAGLMDNSSVSLGASNHGGVTVTLTSSNPAVALVSPDFTTAGTSSIQVFVPNGQNFFGFYVQGMEGQTGTATLTASAIGFTDGTRGVTIVQPGVELIGVPATTTTLSADNNLYAQVGVPNGQNTGLSYVQYVRPGIAGGGYTVTFVADTPAVATLTNTVGGIGTPRTAVMVPGTYYTPTTVATGGVALHPVGNGVGTLQVTSPGLLQMSANGVRTVTVSQPGITVGSLNNTGAGLMDNGSVSLGASNHGGVTVTLTSSNPAVALVSPNFTTPGSASIQVVVPNGQTSFSYYLQGVEGQTGTATLTAQAPGFTDGTRGVTIVQPGVELIGVPATTTTLSADNNLYAQVGVPNGQNTGLSYVQYVRPGITGGSIPVTFASSVPTVATLNSTANGLNTPQTVNIASGVYYSPTTVGTGGVALHPILAGGSTFTVTAPGLLQMSSTGVRAVTVTQPGITVGSINNTGAGLMDNGNVALGAANHGGVLVTIASSNPGVALVSPDFTTPGTDTIQIFVANGQASLNYYVQGVEGASGTVTITALAPGFTNGTRAVTIVPAAVELVGPSPTQVAGGADNAFYAQVGVANAQNTGLAYVQYVRAGAPAPLTATFTSQQPAIGTLVNLNGVSATRTALIAAGVYYTPTNVAGGGVAFRPLAAGSTTVTVDIPGLVRMTTNGNRLVTVTP